MNELIVTCNVVEDLMPLYADGICSEDTKTVVEHHTAECPACKKKLEDMTAKLNTPAEPQKELERSKLFKVFHKKYTKLGIITLILCGAILIPGAICGVLTLNEYGYYEPSWSTLKAERQLKEVASLMAGGKSGEAAAFIGLDGIWGQMFTDDFNAYFSKYPVSDFDVNVQYINFVTNSEGDSPFNPMTGEITFYTSGNYFSTLNVGFIISRSGQISYAGIGNMELTNTPVLEPDENHTLTGAIYNTYTGIPRYSSNAIMLSNSFCGYMREKMYKEAILNTIDMDSIDIYSDYLSYDDVSKWGEYKEKADAASKWDSYKNRQAAFEDLCESFEFYDIESRGISYEVTENDRYYKGYLVQDYVMWFNNDGCVFSIRFTARLSDFGLIMPAEKIIYSVGTPEEFKKQFEVLFT